MNTTRGVKLSEMSAIFASGGVLSFTLDPIGRGFALRATTRSAGSIVLHTSAGRMRDFMDLRTALLTLKEIGAEEAKIRLSDWEPEQKERLMHA